MNATVYGMSAANLNLDASNGPECKINNALVWQKDEMIYAINSATDSAEVGRCRDKIELLAPLWHAVGYAYKTKELFARLVTRAEFIRDGEQEAVDGMRKNAAFRFKTEKHIERLNIMIGEMKS